MNALHLTAPHLLLDTVNAAGWLAAGLAIGAVYYLSLRWNVRMFTDGRSLFPALAIQLGRFVAVGIILALIVHAFGALALLVTTAGILLARSIIIRLGAWP
jgi:F1F0 ATPase subunit 2